MGALARQVIERFRDLHTTARGVVQLLAALEAAGITLTIGDDGLRCDGPTGALTDDLRRGIRTYNHKLLKLVTADPADMLSAERCPMCASRERWQWLDGRLLCRACLVLDLQPLTLIREVPRDRQA